MVPDLIGDPFELMVAVGDLIPLFRMGLQDLPLLIGKLARFVEDLQRNSDLADIMQKAEQRQLALLDVRQLDPPAQLRAHHLRAAHMVLRIAVALLKRPDQR